MLLTLLTPYGDPKSKAEVLQSDCTKMVTGEQVYANYK